MGKDAWKWKDKEYKYLLLLKKKVKHHFKKLRRPFVFCADFESLTQEIEEPEDENIVQDLQLSRA